MFITGIALAAHMCLCSAFLSMAIFSVVLMDRVADVLFAMTVARYPSGRNGLRFDEDFLSPEGV